MALAHLGGTVVFVAGVALTGKPEYCDSARRAEITAPMQRATATADVLKQIRDWIEKAPLPAQPIDPPTLAMSFSVNDSPWCRR